MYPDGNLCSRIKLSAFKERLAHGIKRRAVFIGLQGVKKLNDRTTEKTFDQIFGAAMTGLVTWQNSA